VHVLNLVRGNIIQDKIGLTKDKDKKEKYQIITKADLKNMMESEFSGPLSDEDVKKIVKEYKLKRFGFDRVTIENSIPFAPVMFLGVIITILTSGALILLVSI
jgi:hypothetical protein